MKFTKPNAEASKKTKASLSVKAKFKSKDAVVPIVKLQKNTKQAANLIKQMVNDKELNIVLKNEPTGGASKKSKKKKTNKPGELSPEVQMGLKLDRLIEQKIKEQNKNAEASPLSLKGKNAKPLKESTNSSSSLSEHSPKANKKRKKGKKKGNNENNKINTKSTQPIVSQIKSNGDSPEKLNPNKKQGKKRKNENVVQSSSDVASESTDEPTKVVVAKPKKKMGKGKQQSVSNEDPKEEEAGDLPADTFTLNSKDVLKAVKSSIDLFKKISKSSKKLLDTEPDPMFLHFKFFYPHNKQRIIRFELCSSLVTSSSDVCLFVADIAKNNADESKAQWEKILRDEKVTNISEVIPLRSLATDYTQFQDKRKLSERFDFFLVDGKISHRVYRLLGSKFFHSKRKTPAPIMLKKGKMADNITKGLAKTVAQYTPAADSFSVQVGHTEMDERDIMKNILKVWEQYPEQFGVYWENIERASLFSPQTSKLPIFVSLSPPKGKPREYKNMKWTKGSDTPVQGELSTAMDKPVLVYPDGRVIIENVPLERSAEAKAARREKNKEKKKLLRMKKKNKVEEDSDEEEDDEELDSDDDLGGRADMLESETDDDEPPKKKPAGKQDAKKTVVPEKKSKKIQTLAIKRGNDSDSDIAEEAEISYLRDLAAEKKAKGKAQVKGKGGKDQKSNSKDSEDGEDNDSDDSSHPEDDEIEDSLDDLEDLSMEEDSESDDDEEEQVVKKPPPKPKAMKKNNKGNKKINGSHQQSNPKPQRQMAQKKSGASKSPQNKKAKKKQDSGQSSSPEGTSNKKKASGPTFQGSQANQKQKKSKNQQGVKNKQMARQLAK